MARLDYILRLMASEQADAVRMAPGAPPALYFGRSAKHLDVPPFNGRQMQEFVRELTTPEDLQMLQSQGAAHLHYEYEGALYQCEVTRGRGGMEVLFRPVAAEGSPLPPPLSVPGVSAPVQAPPAPPAPPGGRRGRGPSLGCKSRRGRDERGPEPVASHEPPPPAAEPEVAVERTKTSRPAAPRPDAPRFEGRQGNRNKAPVDGEFLDLNFLEAEGEAPDDDESMTGVPKMNMRFKVPRKKKGGGLRPAAQIHYTREEATVPPIAGEKLSKKGFHRLLQWMVEQDATDMHVTPNFPPTLRVDGVFQPSQGHDLSPEDIEKTIVAILDPWERKELDDHNSVDLSYDVEGIGRFRINIFRQYYGVAAAVRYIRGSLTSLENLNLPPELAELGEMHTGLVLYTGPTGSGKSTTMSAILEQMNQNKQLHVITLEAPIEYLFESKQCLFQQREVGQHTASFGRGLKDALRENPDVIMVGELRDLETVKMAINASETGHLIMATMHANSTGNAISRLVDVFPDSEKTGARAMISEVLKAVVNLRLLPHASGRGLVPAVELLRTNPAINRVIREGKMHQVRQVLSTALADGMWTFERNLAEQVRAELISKEVGEDHSEDKRLFHTYLESEAAARAYQERLALALAKQEARAKREAEKVARQAAARGGGGLDPI